LEEKRKNRRKGRRMERWKEDKKEGNAMNSKNVFLFRIG
jgi:hypothetical protein